MPAVSILPRGTDFVRTLICLARAGNDGDPIEVARASYGSKVELLTRAAVSAGSLNSGDWGAVLATPEAAEFFGAVEQAAIVGRLPALRTVPLNVRTQLLDAGFSSYWLGAGQPKPLSQAVVLGDVLPPRKIAGLFVATQEMFRTASPGAEARLRADLVRTLAEGIDAAFIDAGNAGVANEMPAAVTYGSDTPALASSGNPAEDIAALVEMFPGDFATAAFVTDPTTAAQIALARDAGGAYLFPDVGPRGGTLLNLPLLVSRSSPRTSAGGQLALVDGSGIAYGAEGVRTQVSTQATLEMLDNPTNDSTTPTPTTMVSMYQTNSVAVLSEIYANWRVVRPAVALITDALYSTSAETP